MNGIRSGLLVLTFALLCGGYFASQYFAFTGEAASWAVRVDAPSVTAFCLALLIAIVAASFYKRSEE